MTKDIVEAGQPMATAMAVIEKKARQLVYDSRYEINDETKGKNIDPVTKMRMIIARISKSRGIPAVIARAKQMVSKKGVKEEYILEIQESASDSVANAMFKVFVEGVQKEEVIELPYERQLAEEQERKYKIRVTDPKTGNSYVRYGTRDKITQLRLKGLKVEMTEYGEPREGERKRGEQTARATGGGRRSGGKKPKLDPVGKEDSDPDNDGKHNDPNDKYIMKRRAAIGSAIEKRKTVSASYEPEGEVIDEAKYGTAKGRKALAKKVRAGKDVGKKGAGFEAIVDKASPKVGKKRATKIAAAAMWKNLANSYEPEGEMLDEKHKKGHKKNDGNLANNYPPYDKVTRGDVIAGRLGKDEMGGVKKEDYLWSEGTTSTEGQNTKKIDVMKNGEMNKVTVFPQDSADPQAPGSTISASFEANGPILTERAKSRAQQRFMAMVYARKKGAMKKGEASPEVEAAAKGMSKKEAKKFAKTKHKGLPGHVKEAADCGCDDKEKERDTRGDYAKINMVKNKLRAMGAKNPIVMVASEQHRPPAGWKSYGPTPEDKNPAVKIPLGGVFQAGPDGKVPAEDKPVRQASKPKGGNKTA